MNPNVLERPGTLIIKTIMRLSDMTPTSFQLLPIKIVKKIAINLYNAKEWPLIYTMLQRAL